MFNYCCIFAVTVVVVVVNSYYCATSANYQRNCAAGFIAPLPS